jgi:CBS domain-containing protein
MSDEVHEAEGSRLREFTSRVLRDLDALEEILDAGLVETGLRRVGAEQEMFLVDDAGRPAPVNQEILQASDDDRIVPELGRYNLELNLDPLPFRGDSLRQMEEDIEELLVRVRELAGRAGAHPLLTGILPTLRKSEVDLENMTPRERYRRLNRAMNQLRGTPYHFYIKGADELLVEHDSVMVESCNTSFQVHFQVAPDEFAHLYNIAQVATAPVLAAATNSPILFGRRLWHETRIATFRQALDTRKPPPHLRESRSRVHFGRSWVNESVLEIYREDVARFPALLAVETDEDPRALLDAGEIPELEALQLFNSTVYRWNRPCYGKLEGRPHLRIEARVFPSGPTVRDEMANAALWLGLLSALSREYDDIRPAIDFDEVRRNFLAAAQHGLSAEFTWLDGESHGAADLIGAELVPLAAEGLEAAGIDGGSVDRYLGTIAERVGSRRTGSQWFLDSLAGMGDSATLEERLTAVTLGALRRQNEGRPVHEWDLSRLEEGGGAAQSFERVEQFMRTDPITVHDDEPMELVLRLMHWNGVRHIPVEDAEHRLLGLVTDKTLNRFFIEDGTDGRDATAPVREHMETDVPTATPDMTTLEAIRLMQRQDVGCLPVVAEGRLVGVLEERDLLQVASSLLKQLERDPREEP